MKKFLGAALLCVFSILPGRQARAVPAFARAYNVSCSTCHSAIPRRNDFGEAFRMLGYRWPKVAGAEPVNGGAESSAEERNTAQIMHGNSLFTTFLPAKFPFALTGTVEATYSGHGTTPDNDFGVSFPFTRLVGGGALSDHIGFFTSTYLISAFTAVPSVNETYLHLSQLGDRPEFNIRLGYFEPWTTTYKFNNQILSDYYFMSQSPIASNRFGVELNGIVAERGFYAVSALQNGPSTPYANYAYRLGTRIGGATFLGEDLEVDIDDKRWWESFAVTFANWGFFGHNPADPGQGGGSVNELRRFGFDVLVNYEGTAQIFASAMIGHDSNIASGTDFNSTAWLLEGTYTFSPWLSVMYLYQHNAGTGQSAVQDQSVGVNFIPIENLRATLRGTLTNGNVGDRIVDLQIYTAI